MEKDNSWLIPEVDVQNTKRTRCQSSLIFFAILAILGLTILAFFGILNQKALTICDNRNELDDNDQVNGEQTWLNYKENFDKFYETNDLDIAHMSEFLKAQAIVRAHNAAFGLGTKSYRLRLNQLSDMLPEEIYRMLGYRMSNVSDVNKTNMFDFPMNSSTSIPDEIDWRDMGYVTPVKNQGNCGGCYAFSSTGALEGQIMGKTGQLISLSEQDIIDCSFGFGHNRGCDGGLMQDTFEFIKEKGGIESEEEYPYIGKDGQQCKFDEHKSVTTVTGYVNIPFADEEQLKIAVALKGPVSVAIKADDIVQYHTGVYDGENCDISAPVI